MSSILRTVELFHLPKSTSEKEGYFFEIGVLFFLVIDENKIFIKGLRNTVMRLTIYKFSMHKEPIFECAKNRFDYDLGLSISEQTS